jgi:tetratricopeptide (TPR) repeat protein
LFKLGRNESTLNVAMPSHDPRSVVLAGRRLTLPSWRTVGIGAAVVLAVVVLGAGAFFWNASQQQRGAAVYADVLARHRIAENPLAPADTREAAAAELERVLAEYPSNAMAPQAAYLLGNIRFASAQYDRARAAYQIAAARAGSATMATLARAGVGYAWEAEKKLPEAAQAFDAALAGLQPTSFYYEELLADLARVQERAGKKDAAVATYRRLLKDVPKSARTGEVKTRLAALGATP